MDKRTVSSAHERIDILEKDLIAMQTAIKLQFRDLFSRVKRLETIMLAAFGATLGLLVAVLTKMG